LLVGAALAGAAVLWLFGGPDKAPAAEAETSRSIATLPAAQPTASAAEQTSTVPVSERSSPRPEATISAPTVLPPASTLSSTASDSLAVPRERADETSVSSASAKSSVPTAKPGKIQFAIKPWGEILVDGKKRGVSPPLKELLVPEGRHRIEIRNGTFAGYTDEFDVTAGRSVRVTHSFASP